MTPCSAVQTQGCGARDHHCVGDLGHAGPHWCLLGHIWPADPEDSNEEQQ